MCRTKVSSSFRNCDEIVDEYVSDENDTNNIFSISHNNSKNAWYKTLLLNNKEKVLFKIDTGAESNILPYEIYEKMKESDLTLESTNTVLVAFGGSEIKPLGKAKFICEYNNHLYDIYFYIVDTKSVPILGLQSCVQLGIIKNINVITKENLLEKFDDVFKGLGKYPKKYKIQLKEDSIPHIQRPRNVPISIQEKLKEKLNELEANKIIAKVEGPTDWVNSLVITSKKNGDLRLCIDPTKLNAAIRREYFPIPTAKLQIATKLNGKKIFYSNGYEGWIFTSRIK